MGVPNLARADSRYERQNAGMLGQRNAKYRVIADPACYCLTTTGAGNWRRRYSLSVKPSIVARVWAAFSGLRSWAALKMGSVAISRAVGE